MEKIGLTLEDAKALQARIMTRKYEIINSTDATGQQAYSMAAQEAATDLGVDPKQLVSEMNALFGAMSEGGRANKPTMPPVSAIKAIETYDDMTFADRVRAMAKTGFVPYGKYLIPMIGERKADQISPYMSTIKAEGNYQIEKNSYGWICTPVETPEQREKRETLAKIAELQRQIAELAAKVK